jgi:hypothetical protein
MRAYLLTTGVVFGMIMVAHNCASNHKKLSRRSDPDRDQQFLYIAELRERFSKDGQPTVSIDTKKKELIGNFRNPGRAWIKDPVLVNDHDFRSDALGLAVPYGVYATPANRGALCVGPRTTPPSSPRTISPAGGPRRGRSAILGQPSCLCWPTAEAATAIGIAPSSTGSRTVCAILRASS